MHVQFVSQGFGFYFNFIVPSLKSAVLQSRRTNAEMETPLTKTNACDGEKLSVCFCIETVMPV